MSEQTLKTSPHRELGLIPAWFGTLHDLRAEGRQLTSAVLQVIDDANKIGMRLAHKVADRIDNLASTALNTAERVVRAPMDVLQ